LVLTAVIFFEASIVVLNELLNKYIKNQFIIPYEISKRKKVYKEAFKELSQHLSK